MGYFPVRCKVCAHKAVHEIDAKILQGMPIEALATAYKISPHVMRKHRSDCLAASLQRIKDDSGGPLAPATSIVHDLQAVLPDPQVSPYTAFMVRGIRGVREILLEHFKRTTKKGEVILNIKVARLILDTFSRESEIVDRERRIQVDAASTNPSQVTIEIGGLPTGPEHEALLRKFQAYLLHRLADIPEACERIAADFADPAFSFDSIPVPGLKALPQTIDIKEDDDDTF